MLHGTKVATQLTLDASVTTPSAQSLGPLHPANADPGSGVAIRAVMRLSATGAVQVTPQLIPAGKLETLPAPLVPTAML